MKGTNMVCIYYEKVCPSTWEGDMNGMTNNRVRCFLPSLQLLKKPQKKPRHIKANKEQQQNNVNKNMYICQ
jgi:hypothetical protein